ncbi:NAD-dependent isocitrate dehydrogenase [Olea europaea subsp. europaea]|uniref:NAD-dependent isocitrate dehydrogenase n=1 Tax=Olea europaea subsp. europaea TaxID=158383 RepID=A0A8S0TSH1_OLEEU|nr:NAD-dependent isocitrate dehydrogenase [Olea europaea subsp. europaea]
MLIVIHDISQFTTIESQLQKAKRLIPNPMFYRGFGVSKSLKVIPKFSSEHTAKYAFEYAHLNGRKKVTIMNKANIMKLADGLFLESCLEVATKYLGINNEILWITSGCNWLPSPSNLISWLQGCNWSRRWMSKFS